MSDTLNEARASNPTATSVSGHSTTVINPTPEEVEARRISNLVEDAVHGAIETCCEDLDEEVRRGRITDKQVFEALRHHDDFSDAWAEWMSEND